MSLLNDNVLVTVYTDAPPIVGAGFGVPLYVAAPGTLGVGFTERVRFYTSPGAVATDLLSGDLSVSAGAAVNAALAQSPRVSRVGVARADEGAAGEYLVTIGGTVADDDVFTVTVDGYTATYTAVVPTDDATAVAAALRAALVALQVGTVLDHVTFGAPSGATFTVTANVGTVALDVQATAENDATAVVTNPTPPGSIGTELDAIIAENSAWYGLITENKTPGFILAVATWVESNERLYIAQSDAPDTITTSTTDVASVLQDNARERTAFSYHHDNAEEFALCWAAKTLQADPDRRTTTWAYKTLSGITVSSLTATQRSNLEAKNANFYGTFFGFGASWEGEAASGRYLDVRLTMDWVQARVREAIAQMYLDVSNQNNKIPYDDDGIQQHAGAINGVLKRGENARHFVKGSTSVQAPLSVDVAPEDKAARTLAIGFTAQLSGAIHKSTTDGYVLITLPGA